MKGAEPETGYGDRRQSRQALRGAALRVGKDAPSIPCGQVSAEKVAAQRLVLDSASVSDDVLLSATMHATPAKALHAVEEAFNKAHVFVTEAHQLGGLALVVHWDMEGDHRQLLVDALLEADVDLHESVFEELQGLWRGPLTGSLHITLEHEGRDSKVPVPSVPG